MHLNLPFGVLRRPHGTSGEILLAPFNGASIRLHEQVFPLPVQLVRAEDRCEIDILAARPVREGFLVCFRGIEARGSVAELVGREVHLPRQMFAPLADGEFYVEDVVGCEAFGLDGRPLGRVAGIFWNGAQDVMTIVAADGSERLLPVVSQFIHSFEPAQRRVVVEFHDE